MAREWRTCAREAVSNERWRDIVRILKWSNKVYFIGLDLVNQDFDLPLLPTVSDGQAREIKTSWD